MKVIDLPMSSVVQLIFKDLQKTNDNSVTLIYGKNCVGIDDDIPLLSVSSYNLKDYEKDLGENCFWYIGLHGSSSKVVGKIHREMTWGGHH